MTQKTKLSVTGIAALTVALFVGCTGQSGRSTDANTAQEGSASESDTTTTSQIGTEGQTTDQSHDREPASAKKGSPTPTATPTGSSATGTSGSHK